MFPQSVDLPASATERRLRAEDTEPISHLRPKVVADHNAEPPIAVDERLFLLRTHPTALPIRLPCAHNPLLLQTVLALNLARKTIMNVFCIYGGYKPAISSPLVR
jgi:hypothetical protein